MGGSHAFGGGDSITATTAAFVVATLVSTQGLSGRKGFVTDRTFMNLTSAVGYGGGVGRISGGCRRG